MRVRKIGYLVLILLLFGEAHADSSVDVHLSGETDVGGLRSGYFDEVVPTAVTYETPKAPSISGFCIVDWLLSTSQTFSKRDSWGRLLDSIQLTPYEQTTVVAVYQSENEDEDMDGVPDALERYWFGNLDAAYSDDRDEDGETLAYELAVGQNPLFHDQSNGGIEHALSSAVAYNPNRFHSLDVRCIPEGALFETSSQSVEKGQIISVGYLKGEIGADLQVGCCVCDIYSTHFAYWTINGVPMRDLRGVALSRFTFEMPDADVQVQAVTESDQLRRAILFWYGSEDVSMTDDEDGDGYTTGYELCMGMNPYLAEEEKGGIGHRISATVDYQMSDLKTCIIRSEPENALFQSVTNSFEVGTVITTPAYNPSTSIFAYWTCNGQRMNDAWGRALDFVTTNAPNSNLEFVAHCIEDKLARCGVYWHGDDGVSYDTDIDGDDATFAFEIANGDNPLFKESTVPSTVGLGGIVHAMSNVAESDLQVYDSINKIILNGYAHEVDFGFGITPVVVDLNDDGLFDIVIIGDDDSRSVLMNVGTRGGPMFEETEWQSAWSDKVAAAQLKDISSFTLNEPVVNPLSYTMTDDDNDGKSDLLASDADGRIWCYKGNGENNFTLQHKVWGGSYAGFAAGLKIAAVDWEDDGDWDLLCGTAEGKLFLIRDPRGGRPSNMALASGADSVSLSWDPSPQSRIRGYNVYRAKQNGEMEKLDSTTIPKLLDKPDTLTDYRYQVTSFSRLYKTGNSKPITVESIPSEEVSASLGKVGFTWRPAAGFSGNEVAVDFAIDNAFHVAAENLTLKVVYDSAVLIPSKVITSGLTENFVFTQTKGNGTWLVSGTGGSIDPGSGTFLTFVFIVADRAQVADTKVTVEEFTLKSVGHENIVPILHNSSGGVTVEDDKPLDDSYVPAGSKGDLNGDGRLSWEDVELFLEWKDRPNEEVPKTIRAAGDFNGDGVMDNRDYGLLKAFYSQKAKNCPSLKGWDKNHGYKGVDK